MIVVVRLLGVDFANRVGLAAGYDRNGVHIRDAPEWGFGFVELGTVTPRPIEGHNAGVQALARRLRARAPGDIVVGANLGVQPGRPVAHAWCDYMAGMRALTPFVHYLAINLTGESTCELLAPHNEGLFVQTLAVLSDARRRRGAPALLLKLPIEAALRNDARIMRQVRTAAIDGVIAVREGRGDQQVARLASVISKHMVLIIAGGIDDIAQALSCVRAGADLVQMYRGFATGGPARVHAIASALCHEAWAAASRTSA